MKTKKKLATIYVSLTLLQRQQQSITTFLYKDFMDKKFRLEKRRRIFLLYQDKLLRFRVLLAIIAKLNPCEIYSIEIRESLFHAKFKKRRRKKKKDSRKLSQGKKRFFLISKFAKDKSGKKNNSFWVLFSCYLYKINLCL